MKRANINMEARGAVRDYNSRGGRSAAMDPSTARPGGQKRQDRSRDVDDYRGTPVARGEASSSTADKWPAERPGEGSGAGIEDVSDGATPVDDHSAEEPDLDAAERQATDPGVSPPGIADVATDPGTDPDTATHAAGAEGTQGRPSGVSDPAATGVQTADAAENTRSEPGQMGEIVGFLSRHGSLGPVVPSHCAGDTTASGGARPGSSSGDDGNAGLASLTPSDGPGAHVDRGVESDDARSLPLGANCAGGVASADAQHDLGGDRNEADDDRPGSAGAAHHGGATRVKAEVGARPAPTDAGTPAAAGEGGVALPVPSDADDGDAHPVTNGSRPLEASTEADDGLPSFSPDGAAPESPAEPDGEQGPDGAVPPSPNGETALISDGLSLLSLADGTREIDDQDEGTRTPEVGGEGAATHEGAAAACAPPPGVVSPPAVAVFVGALGTAIGPGSERRPLGGSLRVRERLGGAPSGAHAGSTGGPDGRCRPAGRRGCP